MKILLASNGEFLIKGGYKLLGIPKGKIRIGYITTASKSVSSDEYVKIHKKMMNEESLFFEEIDIENKSKEELATFFNDKNILHMEGGNTFYLLQAIKNSGFDKLIKELLKKGIIYVGTSVGSSIAGPSIEFSSHIPPNTPSEEQKSLGLVPFLVKSHYTDDKKIAYQKRLGSVHYPVRFLRDGQGLFCEDGICKFVGAGEEVVLK